MNIIEAARTEIMKPLRGRFRDTAQMKEIRVLMEMNPSLNGLSSLGKRLRKIFNIFFLSTVSNFLRRDSLLQSSLTEAYLKNIKMYFARIVSE